MKYLNRYISGTFLVLIFILTGCQQPKNASFPSLTATSTPVTPTAIETLTPQRPEIPALEKNSIEFYRNGKTYEVVIGYDTGEAFFNATPQPAFPKKIDEIGEGHPGLLGYGDFDQDGETEFYVGVSYCGANCSAELRLYEYDPSQDQYFIADRVGSTEFYVSGYKYLDQDDNPELIIKGRGYSLYGGAGLTLFSAVTVMRYENGKITDVTIEFPDIIIEDAESRLEFSRTDGDHQGVGPYTLAVYIYNMHRLGKLDEARPQFDRVCGELAELRKIDNGGSAYCPALWDEVIADIQKYEQTNTR